MAEVRLHYQIVCVCVCVFHSICLTHSLFQVMKFDDYKELGSEAAVKVL